MNDVDSQISASQPIPTPNPVTRSKSALSIILFFIAIVAALLLFGAGYYLGSRANLPLKEQTEGTVSPVPTVNSASPDDLFSRVGEELKNLSKDKKTDLLYKNDLFVWWISPDNLNILSRNSSGVELQVECSGVDTTNQQNMLSSLVPIVDQLFTQNGYTVNSLNSSQSVTDDRFYDYVRAYERGKRKCVLVGNPDCGKGISADKFMNQTILLACTDQYEKDYQEQSQYLRDLELDEVVVTVHETFGDFVYLDVHGRRTGYYIIAKKIDGKWKSLGGGQDSMDCNTVNQYQIPKEIVKECYSLDKNGLVPNSN